MIQTKQINLIFESNKEKKTTTLITFSFFISVHLIFKINIESFLLFSFLKTRSFFNIFQSNVYLFINEFFNGNLTDKLCEKVETFKCLEIFVQFNRPDTRL